MANTSKKQMTTAAKKKAAPKTEVKKETAEVKSIAAKPEAKKLTAAKAPEKLTTAKALEKITAAKEPEKLTVKEDKKPAKAEKKAVKEVKKEAKKEEPKAKKAASAAKKAAPKTVEAAKKEPAKKAVKAEAKTVKAETKAAKTAKAEAKTVKPETKTAKTVKAAKKDDKAVKSAKETKAEPKKAAAKKPAKKAKLEAYEALSLEECIRRVQAMGVQHSYEDYTKFLMDETDLKALEKNIIEGNDLKKKDVSFEKDGYDADLILVTLQKVADTMDVKALDYKGLKKDMNAAVKTKYGEDAEANAAEYLKEFKICEKLLMIGQRKGIGEAAIVSELIGSDVDAFVAHFFDLAYTILPTWQYDDVKFYEDFAFAVLSQYYDLFTKYQLRILIDVADLYIKHGDFRHGDECYGYILRDNQIKDYIYYRFASVYEAIDYNKAKALAYESLQYVDGRYDYYQSIMDIINK